MYVLTVIPLRKTNFAEELTYFSVQNMAIGSLVKVTLRSKEILALVTDSTPVSEAKSEIKNMNFNLKKVVEYKDKSIFREELISAMLDTSRYYVASKNQILSYLIPNIFKEEYDFISKIYWEKNLNNEEKLNLNIKTEKLLFQANFEDRVSYYKTLIRESFASKKSLFIVLPTEKDIENFVEYFKKGIEEFTFTLHGNIKTKKLTSTIETILSCEHSILIIGTAPFLSIPRKDIQTIILENESSATYRTISNPKFDLRVFVEIFASQIGARLIFGDTLLRFETIGRKEMGELQELRTISFRSSFQGDIEVLTKNKKNFLGEEKFKVISDKSIETINDYLSKNKKIFVFSLRKGLATFTVCKNCGTEVSCENCLSPVVLYTSQNGKKRMFTCNKCKNTKDPNIRCGHCGGWDLVPLGIGTETVYEEILRNIKNEYKNKIYRLDKETARNAKEAELIVQEFESSKSSVLVGTEMALFYLKEKIDASIIASFDSLWSIPNFKIGEKILQILLKISERTLNHIIIETKNTEDESIKSLRNGNFMNYVREELQDRQDLGYPPYKRFIKISYTDNKDETTNVRKFFQENFSEYDSTIFGSFIEKEKQKYIINCLIKMEPAYWSLPSIMHKGYIEEKLTQKLNSLPKEFKIEIDPEDFL